MESGRHLGAPWRPSWLQDGAETEKSWFLGSPWGPKLEPKVRKSRLKCHRFFEFIFGSSFSCSVVDFPSQNLSKMRCLRVVFSTSFRKCGKCDLEQPSIVFAIFFEFGGFDFRPETVYFSTVFPMSFSKRIFYDFGWIFVPTWRPNGYQNRYKNLWNFMLNF